MSSNELQALFSNLRPRSQESSTLSPSAAPFTQQSSRPTSSAFFNTAPTPATPPPSFSAAMDDRGAGRDGTTNLTRSTSGATAQNLLNLLNFGGPPQSSATASHQAAPTQSAPKPQQNTTAPISASDLVARFMSPTVSTPEIEQKEENTNIAQPQRAAASNSLLELLNKQASAALASGGEISEQPVKVEEDDADLPIQSIEVSIDTAAPSHEEEHNLEPPVRIFGTAASREHTPFEPPKSASPMPQERKPIFTYTNPFEALNASRQQTPGISSPAPPQVSTPAAFTFQPLQETQSPEVLAHRKKLTPKLRSQRSTNSMLREQSPLPEHTAQDEPEPVVPPEPESMQPSVETSAAAESHEIEMDKIDSIHIEQEQDPPMEVFEHEKQDESGEWEEVDEATDKDIVPREVPVYNFPIKAFVSITLHLGASSDIGIREDGVMEISRLKKDFDQLDRSLAAATSKYITYAFVKNGGMRIIRQDDGSDRHVFKNSHDRIFSVAFCSTATNAVASENQAVLGTGVSGAVYYASVSKEGNDLFEKNQLDLESLIFPPFPHADENTAGGVLKTRAKRSSRHPEYFAIGRGKSIQLVWPATALSPRYGISETNRTVDVEKFYADRPLQISTGKAGKDFTFSEDDTVVVSLDKTGRLRFWDIRSLVDESNATAARMNPVIVDTPILSLSTASPAEKSWPTSVTFVDKSRPYKKGGALRYVLVGLRQNHTLQLWDIALGKAVQELNFPHENETDAICSVNYHPESGIVVVSHPTRNSIFFIHLSAPRYSLGSQLSQATYVQRIAAKDPELPKPESTACMSGIREISFADKGQLRSVELLPVPKSADLAKDESTSLFELYVVHSKGVTCLGVCKEDLGWDMDSKVLHPIDALQEGLVSLKELKLGSVIEEPTRSKSPIKEVQQPTKASKKKAKKTGQPAEELVNGNDELQQPTSNVIVAPPAPIEILQPTPVPAPAPIPEPEAEPVMVELPPKESKKARKKAEKAEKAEKSERSIDEVPGKPEVVRAISPVKETLLETNGKAEPAKVEEPARTNVETVSNSIPKEWFNSEFKNIEAIISGRFRQDFDQLYQNIQNDRAAQESSSASRQEAVLRLVSSSLSTNVEKSLSRILSQQMQQVVVPAVVQHASVQIAETLASALHQSLPQEISTHLPTAVTTALQNPQNSRLIADSLTQKLSKHMETQVTDMVIKTVTPMFASVATAAAEKAASDTEARMSAQLRQIQMDRAADNEKIDRLSNVLQGMANTLQAMSDSQVAFQGQILKDRQALTLASGSSVASTSRQVSTARGTPDQVVLSRPRPMKIRSKAEIELEEVTSLMNEGRYEEGSIKWLQSTQPVKLFDELFVRFTPEYLATDVSPLVAFSVAVTVANSLNTNTERRLEWISAAFDAVDLQDPEIADLSQHAPALITSLIQKLESLYMTIAERNPSDTILRSIPPLAKKGRDMKTAFIARSAGPLGPAFPQLTGPNF